MIEVVFNESAAGCLSIAAGNGKNTCGVSSTIVLNSEGSTETLDQEEIKKIIREREDREHFNWENAIPLETKQKDILCFPLGLSIGDITEEEIGKQREDTLKKLLAVYPESVKQAEQEMLETARISLKNLLFRAENGETIRVWTSDTPDDACGFCWLAEQLKPIGFENLDITYVKLPDFHIMPDKTMVIYSNWGEISPHQWGHLALLAEKVPVNYMDALSSLWQRLKQENTSLRAVVNHHLVSVPETFYDSFILQELEIQKEKFRETRLIGEVLEKYPFGIKDSLIAMRIEQFIKDGKLKAVTQAKSEDPIYCRILRKCY